MLSRRFLVVAPAPAALGLLARDASAQGANLRLGTATEGGTFLSYGLSFIDLMKQIDPTLEIRNVPTRGTIDNLPLLEAGELDLAIVSGEAMYEALEGIGRPKTDLRILCVTFPMPGLFAVSATTRFRSIPDIQGHPVAWFARGSGLAIQARYIMDGLGLDMEKDFVPVYIDTLAAAPETVLSGQVSALWGAGLRWPPFVALADSPNGVRFVAPSSEELQRIRTKHPFLAPLTVPARLYRNQLEAIDTVGSWSLLAARASFPDTVAARIVRNLVSAEQKNLLPRQLAQSTGRNTLTHVAPAALQAGALAQYRQLGLL